MLAAVVILNWNKAGLTRRCLQAARAATEAPVHWIVVDNGSEEPVGTFDPDVTLIRNAENLGFTGGVNAGLRHAIASGAEHVWLLNNDAEPLPGALDRLLAAAQADPSIGLASAVVLNADDGDAVEFYAGMWTEGGHLITTDAAEYQRWLAECPERIWLMGTALLVSRKLLERAGYFDETFFAYWEDNDISYRSAAAGFRNIVVPDAVVRHQAGHRVERPGERPAYYYYYMSRNELLLMRKTGERLRVFYWTFRKNLRLHRRLKGWQAQRRAIRQGFIDGVLGRGGRYAG